MYEVVLCAALSIYIRPEGPRGGKIQLSTGKVARLGGKITKDFFITFLLLLLSIGKKQRNFKHNSDKSVVLLKSVLVFCNPVLLLEITVHYTVNAVPLATN